MKRKHSSISPDVIPWINPWINPWMKVNPGVTSPLKRLLPDYFPNDIVTLVASYCSCILSVHVRNIDDVFRAVYNEVQEVASPISRTVAFECGSSSSENDTEGSDSDTADGSVSDDTCEQESKESKEHTLADVDMSEPTPWDVLAMNLGKRRRPRGKLGSPHGESTSSPAKFQSSRGESRFPPVKFQPPRGELLSPQRKLPSPVERETDGYYEIKGLLCLHNDLFVGLKRVRKRTVWLNINNPRGKKLWNNYLHDGWIRLRGDSPEIPRMARAHSFDQYHWAIRLHKGKDGKIMLWGDFTVGDSPTETSTDARGNAQVVASLVTPPTGGSSKIRSHIAGRLGPNVDFIRATKYDGRTSVWGYCYRTQSLLEYQFTTENFAKPDVLGVISNQLFRTIDAIGIIQDLVILIWRKVMKCVEPQGKKRLSYLVVEIRRIVRSDKISMELVENLLLPVSKESMSVCVLCREPYVYIANSDRVYRLTVV